MLWRESPTRRAGKRAEEKDRRGREGESPSPSSSSADLPRLLEAETVVELDGQCENCIDIRRVWRVHCIVDVAEEGDHRAGKRIRNSVYTYPCATSVKGRKRKG